MGTVSIFQEILNAVGFFLFRLCDVRKLIHDSVYRDIIYEQNNMFMN